MEMALDCMTLMTTCFFPTLAIGLPRQSAHTCRVLQGVATYYEVLSNIASEVLLSTTIAFISSCLSMNRILDLKHCHFLDQMHKIF